MSVRGVAECGVPTWVVETTAFELSVQAVGDSGTGDSRPRTWVTQPLIAARRLQPSAVVVWAQTRQTADPEVFAALPPAHGGRLLVAAGPGWALTRLPPSVTLVGSLSASLGMLAGDPP